MKSINFRFLLASVACLTVLGSAAVMVHALQVRRQSAFLLKHARQSRSEQQFELALRDYQLYLQLAPKDVAAHAEFGLLLADCGQSPSAVIQLEAALRDLRERDDVRRRLVDLEIGLGRFGDAQEHLQVLLSTVRNDGRLWEQLGVCQDARGVYQSPRGADRQNIQSFGAAESFQKALEVNPTRCESYVRLAQVLGLRLDRATEANDWMDELVKKNPDSALAHLLRARYLHLRTKNQEKLALWEAENAAELAEKSAKSDIKDTDLLLKALSLAAELAERTADYDKARATADYDKARADSHDPAILQKIRADYDKAMQQILVDYDKARSYARRAITVDPVLSDGYLALFRIGNHEALVEEDSAKSEEHSTKSKEHSAKALAHREKAIEALQQGIEKAAQRGQLLWTLGSYRIEQRENELDDARKAAELDEAREAVTELRHLPANPGFDPVLIDFLQAKIEAAQGHWYDALRGRDEKNEPDPIRRFNGFEILAEQLEGPKRDSGKGASPQGSTSELLRRSSIAWHSVTSNWAIRIANWRHFASAVQIDPLWVPARMGVAATLASLGQVTALEEYRQIGRLEGMAATGNFEVARLLVLKNLRLQATEQDWNEVETILNRLQQTKPDATDLTLLPPKCSLGRNGPRTPRSC